MKLAQPGSRDLVVGARRTEKGRMHFEWKKDYSLGAARAHLPLHHEFMMRTAESPESVESVAFSILGRKEEDWEKRG